MRRFSLLVLFALFTAMADAPPASAQDDSVILPEGSIDATEIDNESGVAQKLDLAELDSTTVSVMVESTITAPSSGFVLALVSGRFFAHPPVGEGLQVNVFQYGLSANCSAPNIIDVDLRLAFVPDTSANVDWVHMISTQHLYEVSQGQKTICLVAKMNLDYVGVTYEVLAITLTLIFIPTAYGTVDL